MVVRGPRGKVSISWKHPTPRKKVALVGYGQKGNCTCWTLSRKERLVLVVQCVQEGKPYTSPPPPKKGGGKEDSTGWTRLGRGKVCWLNTVTKGERALVE